jgi:hypothetical protein
MKTNGRFFCAVLLAWILLAILCFSPARTPAHAQGSLAASPGLYHPDPRHIWNRLYAMFYVRTASNGREYGFDELDPLLWFDTNYLVTGPSHAQALGLLDEFLRTHAERLINDPLKRALLQRDLWAVFDWTLTRSDRNSAQREELQWRLAQVLERLALASKKIESLPDNYAQAAAARRFSAQYNPERREEAFLPADLFDPHGPWVLLVASNEPVAKAHSYVTSGRSQFLSFIRLPGGRQATLDYLKTLWEFPRPWVAGGPGSGFPDTLRTNPALPQFPVGTQVALVRQMLLFDEAGKVEATRLTESVQLRVYREIPTEQMWNPEKARATQDVYEFRLSRARLFAGDAGGLRAVAPGEKEFPVFFTHGLDLLTMKEPEATQSVVLNSCIHCHIASGIHSVMSHRRLFPPYPQIFEPDPRDGAYGPLFWNAEAAISAKQNRFDWGLLNGLVRAASHKPKD